MRPHARAGVDVPRLHFTDVIGARGDDKRARGAGVAAAGRVGGRTADQRAAQVLVGRNVEHARLGAERRRWPVLAAPVRRAEICALTGARLAGGVDVGTARDRVETAEGGLAHERLAFDEPDGAVAALEEPEIPVARHVDESLHGAAVALVVDEDRRRHFIPVPRVVRMVLMVALDRAGHHVDGHRGRRIQVVSRTLIAHPRTAIARAPVGQLGGGVVIARDPDRCAAVLPLVALGPRVAARLAGCGHGVGAPARPARFGVVGGDESAHAELAARRADHYDTLGHEGRERHVVAVFVLGHFRRPHLGAGTGIERHQHGVVGSEVDFVAVEGDPARGGMRRHQRLGHLLGVAPQEHAGLRVDGHHLVFGRRHEHHAALHDRRGLVPAVHPGREHPRRPQPAHIGRGDLIEGTVAPAVVGAPHHRPVAVGRRREAGGCDRRVVLEHGRHRHHQRRQRRLLGERQLGEAKAATSGEREDDGHEGADTQHTAHDTRNARRTRREVAAAQSRYSGVFLEDTA